MIIKVFLCTFGIICLLIFALPLMSVTLNIGNLFGIVYAIMLIICGIAFNTLIAKIVLGLMLIFLIPFFITIVTIHKSTKKNKDNCNAIVILGCRVKGYKPTLALIERCKAGANYLKQHDGCVAILSGGQGSDELISEADCMKKLMLEEGIEESRLFVENKSTSTNENLLFSKKILNDIGYENRIGIVSSGYHLFRANMIAKSCELEAVALIPAKTKWYCEPTFYTREVFGIWAKIAKIKE